MPPKTIKSRWHYFCLLDKKMIAAIVENLLVLLANENSEKSNFNVD